MEKKYVYIAAGSILFVLSLIYIVWYQTSVVSKIFNEHRSQLQSEIKAIQSERLVLKRIIDSLEIRISLDKKNLLNDIDNFLKTHGKK